MEGFEKCTTKVEYRYIVDAVIYIDSRHLREIYKSWNKAKESRDIAERSEFDVFEELLVTKYANKHTKCSDDAQLAHLNLAYLVHVFYLEIVYL